VKFVNEEGRVFGSMSLRRGLAALICLGLVTICLASNEAGARTCWKEWICDGEGNCTQTILVCVEDPPEDFSEWPEPEEDYCHLCHDTGATSTEDEYVLDSIANHTDDAGYVSYANESYFVVMEKYEVEEAEPDYLGIAMQILWMLVIVVLFPIAFWLGYNRIAKKRIDES
jgi:hypothetical protein